MERKKYFRLVLGASSRASQGVVRALKLPDGVDVDDFCLALHGKRESLNLPPSFEPSALKVFANDKAPTPLELDKSLENYGVNTADPLIVRVPRIWFQLKGADRRDLSCPASVPLTEEDAVEVLLDAVQKIYKDNHLAGIAASDLVVYACDDFKELLPRGGQIGSRGHSEQTPLTVMMAPMRLPIDIGEKQNESERQELQRYQKQGELIHNNCKDYCGQILDKIDYYYKYDDGKTLPFICVQGSSGMGKSQLAFALGGRRPYFYWLGVSGGVGAQVLYGNFTSISNAFLQCVRLDQPNDAKTNDVLDTSSSFYDRDLWTCGFLRALLEHCNLSTPEMIWFEEPVTLQVEKCNREAVRAVIDKVKQEGKRVPFFIFDEMAPDSKGGTNEAAFQRNVFRVCGLLVMVMGTDSKITNLVKHSRGSSGSSHRWMSVVPRFPSYQIMLFTPTEMELWPKISARYPVVDIIVQRSRGRFSRSFIVGAVECFQRDSSIELCDLLDAAFSRVCSDAHKTKMFLNSPDGLVSQVVAISYTNAMSDVEESVAIPSVNTMGASGPALKKRRVQVKASGMHNHFANLVDEEITDVEVSAQRLMLVDEEITNVAVSAQRLMIRAAAWKPQCSFASIVDDMLLYLAILGGKTYSSYYDRVSGTYHSTKQIFSIVNPDEHIIHENTQAPTLDFKRYENMVAHAIFSSSRRNGVRGIPFSDFLPCFLGEFEDKIWMKEVLMVVEAESDSNGRLVGASNLLEGYDAGGLAERTIPFLAPPNTEWPQPILDANTDGSCKFGHLIRAVNEERCDVYVQDLAKKEKAMFVCECKYREENIDVGVVTSILDGLQKRWGEEWKVVVVICTKLTNFRAWKRENIGCVKLKRAKRAGTMIANWVFQPKPKEREKLAIIIETGLIT